MPGGPASAFVARSSDVYQVFLGDQIVHQEIVYARDTASGVAALERAKKTHRIVMSLSTKDRQLLTRKLPIPMQFLQQRRNQIVTLPWGTLSKFLRGSLASAIASAPKTGSNDGSLRSSTSTTPLMNASESHRAADGSTKRKREGSASTEKATDMHLSESDAKNASDARQSRPKRRRSA